jgi:hypothetical protein
MGRRQQYWHGEKFYRLRLRYCHEERFIAPDCGIVADCDIAQTAMFSFVVTERLRYRRADKRHLNGMQCSAAARKIVIMLEYSGAAYGTRIH